MSNLRASVSNLRGNLREQPIALGGMPAALHRGRAATLALPRLTHPTASRPCIPHHAKPLSSHIATAQSQSRPIHVRLVRLIAMAPPVAHDFSAPPRPRVPQKNTPLSCHPARSEPPLSATAAPYQQHRRSTSHHLTPGHGLGLRPERWRRSPGSPHASTPARASACQPSANSTQRGSPASHLTHLTRPPVFVILDPTRPP